MQGIRRGAKCERRSACIQQRVSEQFFVRPFLFYIFSYVDFPLALFVLHFFVSHLFRIACVFSKISVFSTSSHPPLVPYYEQYTSISG